MDENENTNLDSEFKRYLQIMRPYLEQLLDQDVIEICKAWIQKLSSCKDNEKTLRNKYVFALCYQLARGVLDEPFLKFPTKHELSPLADELDSDTSSTEVEYIVINSEEDNTNVLYNKDIPISEADCLSQDESDNKQKQSFDNSNENPPNQETPAPLKQELFCYTCPDMPKGYEQYKITCEEYKCRANNLVMKLREIKTQNMLLQKELDILRQELKMKSDEDRCNNNTKVDNCTSCCCQSSDSSTTLNNLKIKLQEAQDSRSIYIQTIEHLQDKLNRLDKLKKNEIEEILASHKMEIIKTKTTTRDETREIYEKKIQDLKENYEMMLANMRSTFNYEKQEAIATRDRIISEREQVINSKDNEIIRLKNLNDDQKSHLQGVINKFLEKPNDDTSDIRYKAEQLEKRLSKMEKSKTKCARVYEAKLAHMQREKHLAECSLQLQLVRQRATVVTEITEENQSELTTALTKLENKYKEIVANMQATAIQRRVQDQMAIDSILQAACGVRAETYTACSQNRSQFSGKTMQNQNMNGNQINQSFDSEISALLSGNKVDLIAGSKSLGEESVMAGYCLDGERMGELFERVYIPQRDIGDGPLKK